LFLWGALSDERTGLSVVHAAGSCQRSHSRVRVPWDWRRYFTVSDLRLPISSPPTTRRVTWRCSIPPPHGCATNTCSSRGIIGRVIFYAVRVLSKENLWVCLCIPLSLVGNNSVKTFPRQRRIAGSFVFCAVHVGSKKTNDSATSSFL
jgi:hypothetical protein